MVATPGLTALRDPTEARRVLLDDALRGVELAAVADGPIADVGSGGGSPGIPLAVALPARPVTLIESQRRKCRFLEQWAAELPNLTVTWGRAELQPPDAFGVVTARALAPPPVAAEWCLPLARPGGRVVLWVGADADAGAVAAVAHQVAGRLLPSPEGFLVLEKTGPTPAGFPRRPGMARKRPL